MKILFIDGPNINMLGKREEEFYGKLTYDEMKDRISALMEKEGVSFEFFQSNCEGEIVTRIQEALGNFDGIVINPAAYTHTSVAIRDALISVSIPAVEVHISNVYGREDFRKKSMIEDVVIGKVCGFGWFSYYLGAKGLINYLRGGKVE